MSQWPFVLAAYGLAITLTVGLTVITFIRMRRAEAAADALKRR